MEEERWSLTGLQCVAKLMKKLILGLTVTVAIVWSESPPWLQEPLVSNSDVPDQLVLSINSGRTGSFFLSRLLSLCPATLSHHEEQPNMSGFFLRRAAIYGLTATRPERMLHKKNGISFSFTEAAAASVARYSDTASTCADSWHDLMLRGIDALRGNAQVTVVVLRRYLPATMASYQRLKVFEFPSSIALRWNIPPHFTNKTLTRPLAAFKESSSDELLLSSLIETESLARLFLSGSRKAYLNYSTVEVRLEDITTVRGAKQFLSRLPGRSCEIPTDILERFVEYQPEHDVVKEARRLQSSRERCRILSCNARFVHDYFERAKKQGVWLPHLPHMAEVGTGRCGGSPTEHLGHVARQEGLASPKIAITFPTAEITVVVAAELRDFVVVHFSLVDPMAGPSRAHLQAERHLVMHYHLRVLLDDSNGKGCWVTAFEEWADDEIFVRQAAVRSASAPPPHESVSLPLKKIRQWPVVRDKDGAFATSMLLAELCVELVSFDSLDMKFLGRAKATTKRSQLTLVARGKAFFRFKIA